MGYYTYYTMDVQNITDEEQYNAIIEEMQKKGIYKTDDYAGIFEHSEYYEETHDALFETYDDNKWYEHENDILDLSELFPNVTFKLHGEGEERDDMWNKYFQNGKYEECYAHITYDAPYIIKWNE